MTVTVECPDCGEEFPIDDPIKGSVIKCPQCGMEQEVVETNPLRFRYSEFEEENWVSVHP